MGAQLIKALLIYTYFSSWWFYICCNKRNMPRSGLRDLPAITEDLQEGELEKKLKV